ncbi:putative magnesium transporter NIPA4, partial [Cucumispora dikerogammari]
PCSNDADCFIRDRPDVHSLFCVDNICKKLVAPNLPCKEPSDCSSYSFFGPIACSARCYIENECITGPTEFTTQYCCRQIPEGKECTKDRPKRLNGCNGTSSCLLNEQNEYVCTSKRHLWLFGVLLSVTGNLLINIGFNLQKLSFSKATIHFSWASISTFQIGLTIYVAGKISSFSSYIFGKQSLITSLGGLGLIMNCVLAPLINNENFSLSDAFSILLVLLGSSVIIMNSVKAAKTNSLCELIKMYQNKTTVFWFIFLFTLLLLVFLIIKYIEVNSEWNYPDDFFEFLRTDSFFEQTDFTLRYLMAFLYLIISGVIASVTTLFAKSFGLMVEMSVNGENQFLFGITYLFFIGIIACTFGQVFWLNRALRHYDALLCIPLLYVFWTLFSNLNAGFYFKDFEHFSKIQFKGFLVGWLIILLGVGLLASRSNYDTVGIEETDLESENG